MTDVRATFRKVRATLRDDPYRHGTYPYRARRFWNEKLLRRPVPLEDYMADLMTLGLRKVLPTVPPHITKELQARVARESVVVRAGPRRIKFAAHLYSTPTPASTATSYYASEAAAPPATTRADEAIFAETPLLTPRSLTGLIPVSRYLMAVPRDAREFLLADICEVMALRQDLAYLRGTGTFGEPRGLWNLAGAMVEKRLGFDFTDEAWKSLLLPFRGYPHARPVAFIHHEVVTAAEAAGATVDFDGSLYGDTGTFAGELRWFATNSIPANLLLGASERSTGIVVADMNEVIVAESDRTEIDVSSEASYTPDGGKTWISAFQVNQTLFRFQLQHDITSRRPSLVRVTQVDLDRALVES